MAKKKFWLGMLVLVLALGMMVVGCEDDPQIEGPVDGNRVTKPTAYPAGGEIAYGQEIILTSTTSGVTIYYTLDGTTPKSSSNSYTNNSKPKITSSCTLKAIATKDGMIDSEVLSVSYTTKEKIDNTIYSVSISPGYGNDPPKVGTSLDVKVENKNGYSVSGVSYQWKRADSEFSTFVNISNATNSFYTPTIDDAGKYLKVEAKNSDTTYPVLSDAVGPVDANQVAKPTASSDAGEVVPGQKITLSTTTQYAQIYYTLDSSTPTKNSTLYSSYPGIEITKNCTLKAIATYYGMVDSEVLSVSYTVVAAPSFSSVTSTAAIFNRGIYSVTYGNNKFVAGGNNRMAYSTNGTTWIDASGADYTFNGFGLVKGITYGSQFVAVGYNNSGGVINYSSDGTSWYSVTTTTFGTSNINDVAYDGGRYVAVGENGKMAYSTNGTTWTAVGDSTFDTSTIYGITYAAGKFVAVGASGKMTYSTNGTTWTAVTDSTFTSTINGITYGGASGKEKFIAVGSDGSGSYQIAYSADGVTWTKVQSFDNFGGLFASLNRVVWGGNKFIAVASSGVMYYSPDGTYWAKIDGGTGTGKSQFDNIGYLSSIKDITYGGGKFLAVGIKNDDILGTGSGEMATSNQQ